MACEHVFDENSFSLMETLVNGSVLRPVGKASMLSLYVTDKSFNSSEGMSDLSSPALHMLLFLKMDLNLDFLLVV